MPDKHFYFSIGAALGAVISIIIGRSRHSLQKNNFLFQYLYKKDKHWFLFFPILIFTVGIWGLVPDIIHALKILPKDVTRSDIFNIFFMHSYFEKIEDIYPFLNRILNWSGEIILLSISISTMIFYIQQVKRAIKY
jgi:hypothetical protein